MYRFLIEYNIYITYVLVLLTIVFSFIVTKRFFCCFFQKKVKPDNVSNKINKYSQLTEEDKQKIKEYITKNFIEKKDYTKDKLTNDFLIREMNICIRHNNIRQSHHMSTLYLDEYRNKINDIIKNKFL